MERQHQISVRLIVLADSPERAVADIERMLENRGPGFIEFSEVEFDGFVEEV